MKKILFLVAFLLITLLSAKAQSEHYYYTRVKEFIYRWIEPL